MPDLTNLVSLDVFLQRAFLGLAIVLQFFAAWLAFRLIRVTHNRLAWGLIGTALVLLGVRTSLVFSEAQIFSDMRINEGIVTSLALLVVSLLLVAGFFWIAPIIRSVTRSEEKLQESESRYQSLVNNMQEGVALHELILDEAGAPVDYRLMAVNPAYELITGLSQDEVIGRLASEVYGSGTAPYLDEYAHVATTGKPTSFEVYYPPLGKHLSISVFSPGTGLFGTVFEDITKRKEAEEALHFAQFALDNASDSIFLVDFQGALVYVNDAACTELGYERSELLSMHVPDFDPRFNDERWHELWQRMRERAFTTFESVHCTADGRLLPVEVTCNILKYQGQEYVCAFVSDITARKEAEEELRQSEERFRTSVDNMLDAFGIFTAIRDSEGAVVDFRIEYLNPAACAMYGVTLEEQIYKRMRACEAGNWEMGLFDAYTQVVEMGEPLVLTSHIDRHVGEGDALGLRVFDVQAVKLWDGFIASWRDVTERFRIEEQLHAETERLATTLGSIGDGVITTDREGCIVLMNRVAEELTGWTQAEAVGRMLHEVFRIIDEHSREHCENPVDQVLQSGAIVGLSDHSVLISRTGAEYLLNDSGAPVFDREGTIVGVVLVFRDVTEKRRLENELQRSAKLESLGILAGGIAHDFNNILTAILGNLSLARIQASEDHPALAKLDEAERAATRARDITQQLLIFSKGGSPVKQLVSMPALLAETTSFALLGSSVKCELTVEPDVWPVEVDAGQISQVIHNLIINANQAMPHGGVITVSVANFYLEQEELLPAGPYTRIIIEDQGIGIEPEELPKIFDPFFTTKLDGSGLGLATAYSIIRNHRGRITVDSEVDVGTRFTIDLPALPGAVAPGQPVEELTRTNNGRILVMDDEDFVLETMVAMLEVLGYTVVAVSEGAIAVQEYRAALEAGRTFDLVMLDLTVRGGMGGREVMEALRAMDPQVRAIVSSGYSTDPIMADYRHYGFAGVIAKPYKVNELSDVVRRVLADHDVPVGS